MEGGGGMEGNRKALADGDFPLLGTTHDVGTIFVVHQGLVVSLPLRAHLLDPISLNAFIFPLIMADTRRHAYREPQSADGDANNHVCIPKDGLPDPVTSDVPVIHFPYPAEQRHAPIAEDTVDEELQEKNGTYRA